MAWTLDRLTAAWHDKLSGSGLTPENAADAGMHLLTREEVRSTFPSLPTARGSAVLPYVDLEGRATGFVRLRLLEPPSGPSLTDPLRYLQPPNTGTALYIPPHGPVGNGSGLGATDPLWITEGELKALSGAVRGLPVVGLGGVWSFRDAEGHLLAPLLALAGNARPIHIVFDSDAETKEHVCKARNALCRALTDAGASPSIVRLPSPTGDKVGLDDFLVAHGLPALLALPVETWDSAIALHDLNEEVIYVRDPGSVHVRATGQRLSPRAFHEHAYAPRRHRVTVGERVKEVSTAKAWLEWPGRATAARYVYAPGAEPMTRGALNLWTGYGVSPAPGDVTPWRRLVDFLFSGVQDYARWFEQWCAYPLQHPGVKLYTAPVVWGTTQGTGKTLVGYTLKRLYGTNAIEIDNDRLHEAFNGWAFCKQFVIGDEITGGHTRRMADKVKSLVTRDAVRVRLLYTEGFEVADCINYYFTSQHPDAFFVEDTDRRYFVWEAPRHPLPRAFYEEYDRWYKGDGTGALFHHLLTLPLDGFDPRGPAPETAAKRAMIEDSRDTLGLWVADLARDPLRVLTVNGRVLDHVFWTAEELMSVFDPLRTSRYTVPAMGRELRRAGFVPGGNGEACPTVVGRIRLWQVRPLPEGAEGLMRSPTECGRLYGEERGLVKPLGDLLQRQYEVKKRERSGLIRKGRK